MNRGRVVISAGHHPGAQGARAFGLTEHAEACRVTAALYTELKNLGFDVGLIGGTLQEKAARANAEAPIICAVDVHFNASPVIQANGTETLYGSNPLDRTLAEDIQRHLVAAIKLRDRGVKFADYAGTEERDECYFTRMINAPAAIVECLFLTNPGDSQNLMGSYPIHKRIAEGIAGGIAAFATRLEAMHLESQVHIEGGAV